CVAVRVTVALGEGAVADACEVPDRGLARIGEVGVAVAEVFGPGEFQSLRQLRRPRDRVAVVREALLPLARRQQDALAVATPLLLAAVERGSAADRDEHVLQRSAARVMRMRLVGRGVWRMGAPGRDGLRPERLCQFAQRRQPPRVAALVGPLQLDEEA